MFKIEIGEVFDPEVLSWPEGCHYNYDSGGHWLSLFLSNPHMVEIDSMQKQSVQFGMFLRRKVVFLLFKFGVMPWSSAPYSYWLVSPENRIIPEVDDPPESHALLKAVMVDSHTGVVKALRVLTFSAEFTTLLHQAILEQTQETMWSPSHHEEVIREVALEYPSTESMLKDSVIMCNGGE